MSSNTQYPTGLRTLQIQQPELSVFEFHADEIPTCPYCEARTEIVGHDDDGDQIHKCLNVNCQATFIVCFEDDEDE